MNDQSHQILSPRIKRIESSPFFRALSISFMLTVLFHLLSKNNGIVLSDEGHVWYGAVATFEGQVPLRDFQSYDPGRYYWCAAWFHFFGKGIGALRLATSIFQGVGVFFGLLITTRLFRSWAALLGAGLLFTVWMTPRYWMFEHGLVLIEVYSALLIMEKPSLRRHFIAGVIVGLVAFWGRNHGLYSFLGCLIPLGWLWRRDGWNSFAKRGTCWGVGIIAGYSPMLLMIAFIPEYWDAFWYSVLSMAKHNNVELPVPWPWTIHFSSRKRLYSLYEIVGGGVFIAAPLLFLYVIISSYLLPWRETPRWRVMLASASIGIFELHHAYSCANMAHLAAAIHPFLLSMVGLCSIRYSEKPNKHAFRTTLGCCVILAIAGLPGNLKYFRIIRPHKYVRYEISDKKIWTGKRGRDFIECCKKLDREMFEKNEEILIMPYYPSLYLLMDKRSPVWQIYFGLPVSEEKQTELIKAMEKKRVRWIIYGHVSGSGRDENKVPNTHPLFWGYISQNYEKVVADCLPENHQLLRLKEPRD